MIEHPESCIAGWVKPMMKCLLLFDHSVRSRLDIVIQSGKKSSLSLFVSLNDREVNVSCLLIILYKPLGGFHYALYFFVMSIDFYTTISLHTLFLAMQWFDDGS